MCGIIGFSSKSNFDKKNIKLLFTYNTLERGQDSIGMYSPLNGLYKKAGKPVELIPKMDIKEDNYFIGHVRSSTVGAKTDKNAHPFQFEELIGVMNGTTTNHWPLVRKYKLNSSDYDVDSEAIFAIIQKNQSFTVLGELSGGCAVIIADTRKPNVMFVYRNSERPLFYGFISNSENAGDKSMYISSIKESLEIIDCEEIEEFAVNTIHIIIEGKIMEKHILKQEVYNPIVPLDLSGRVPITYTTKLNNSSYLNRWVLFDSPLRKNDPIENLIDQNWYFCNGYDGSSEYDIVVKDGKSKLITINKTCFTLMASFPHKGDPMMITCDLKQGKKGKIIFTKGQIVELVEYTKDCVEVIVPNKSKNDTWEIKFNFIRPLNLREKQLWTIEQNKKLIEQYSRKSEKPNEDIKEHVASSNIMTPNLSPIKKSILPDPNTSVDWPEEDLFLQDDSEWVIMTYRDLKRIRTQLLYGFMSLREMISKNIHYPKAKSDLLSGIVEMEDYIETKIDEYTK